MNIRRTILKCITNTILLSLARIFNQTKIRRMKPFNYIITALLFVTIISCDNNQRDYSKETSLNTLIDSASYAIGFQTGKQLMSQGFEDIDLPTYISGFENALDNEETLIPTSEVRMLYSRLNEYISDKLMVENEAEERAFMAENRMKEGVIETASGLQYKIITDAEGPKPFAQNKVVVMYEGRLIDGTIFDTTYDSGNPSEFVLGQTIPGWIEGIQLMSIGSEYEFYIPSNLAYGENPRSGVIEPGDALIFKVELLEIK